MSTEQRESPSTSGLWYESRQMLWNDKPFQSRCPSPVPTFFEDANLLLYSPMSQEDIRWNWEKVIPTKFPISAKQDCYIQWWCEWCLQQAQTNWCFKQLFRTTLLEMMNTQIEAWQCQADMHHEVTLIVFLSRFCLTRTGSLSDGTLPWWNPSRLRRTSSACWPSENFELSVFLVREWRPGPKPWRARADEGLLPHPVHGVGFFGGTGQGNTQFPFNNIHVSVKRFGWSH